VLRMMDERERERSYMGVRWELVLVISISCSAQAGSGQPRPVRSVVAISVSRIYFSKLATIACSTHYHAVVSDPLVHSRICSHPSAERHPPSDILCFRLPSPPSFRSLPSPQNRSSSSIADPPWRWITTVEVLIIGLPPHQSVRADDLTHMYIGCLGPAIVRMGFTARTRR
jgi:hypothetical protein